MSKETPEMVEDAANAGVFSEGECSCKSRLVIRRMTII